jgi:hypothetical protein
MHFQIELLLSTCDENCVVLAAKARFPPLVHLAAKLLAALFRQQRSPVCATVKDTDHVY